jgi:hypothetical protein
MGRARESADADRLRIEDPWDVTATLFVACDGSEPMGTIRYTHRADGPKLADYACKTCGTAITPQGLGTLMTQEAHRPSSWWERGEARSH